MSEQAPDGLHPPEVASEQAEPGAPDEPSGRLRTGASSVDSVLEDLEGLDDLPLDEHVSAFERAHESLRSALDADPDAGPAPARAPDDQD